MKQVHNITYIPTKKIYIGKVAYESFRYFGSPDMDVVNEDFHKLPKDIQQDYTVSKEILWASDDCSDSGLAEKAVDFIRQFQSNNPVIGYNPWSKFSENT